MTTLVVLPDGYSVRPPDGYATQGGGFMASRLHGGAPDVHLGTDLLVKPGDPVLAMVRGRAIRPKLPYPDDLSWKGLLIRLPNGGELTLFYMVPLVEIVSRGEYVEPNTIVGIAQDISRRYPADKDHATSAADHVHAQLCMPRTWRIPNEWRYRVDYCGRGGCTCVNVESAARLVVPDPMP